MRMTWWNTAKFLGISDEAVKFDSEYRILQNYCALRGYKNSRVWYPCNGGWLTFGKDATDYGRGMQMNYVGVACAFTDNPPANEWKCNLRPAHIAPTTIKPIDIVLLKALKILT